MKFKKLASSFLMLACLGSNQHAIASGVPLEEERDMRVAVWDSCVDKARGMGVTIHKIPDTMKDVKRDDWNHPVYQRLVGLSETGLTLNLETMAAFFCMLPDRTNLFYRLASTVYDYLWNQYKGKEENLLDRVHKLGGFSVPYFSGGGRKLDDVIPILNGPAAQELLTAFRKGIDPRYLPHDERVVWVQKFLPERRLKSAVDGTEFPNAAAVLMASSSPRAEDLVLYKKNNVTLKSYPLSSWYENRQKRMETVTFLYGAAERSDERVETLYQRIKEAAQKIKTQKATAVDMAPTVTGPQTGSVQKVSVIHSVTGEIKDINPSDLQDFMAEGWVRNLTSTPAPVEARADDGEFLLHLGMTKGQARAAGIKLGDFDF